MDEKQISSMDLAHEFWLVYCQLKDVEPQPESLELLGSACHRLGQLVNVLTHRQLHEEQQA